MNIFVFGILLVNAVAFSCSLELTGRILGGRDSNINDTPYMVSILCNYGENSKYCGGTLIAEQWILTAAHCIYDVKSRNIFVYTGNDHLIEGTKRKVQKLIAHEKYKPDNLLYDIGLIQLESPVRGIRFVELESEETDNGQGVVLGWGYRNNHQPSSTLQRLKISYNDCSKLKRDLMIHTEDLICSPAKRRLGVYSGDSGGPLISTSNNKQIGIIFANLQYFRGLTDVFTRVSSFTEWIKTKMSTY